MQAIDLYDMQPQAHWVNPDPLRWNGGFYSLDIAPQRAEAADDAKKYLTMQGSCSDIARFVSARTHTHTRKYLDAHMYFPISHGLAVAV